MSASVSASVCALYFVLICLCVCKCKCLCLCSVFCLDAPLCQYFCACFCFFLVCLSVFKPIRVYLCFWDFFVFLCLHFPAHLCVCTSVFLCTSLCLPLCTTVLAPWCLSFSLCLCTPSQSTVLRQSACVFFYDHLLHCISVTVCQPLPAAKPSTLYASLFLPVTTFTQPFSSCSTSFSQCM